MKPTICTAGGREYHLLRPDLGPVDIDDIAHALSNLCRFGGHTRDRAGDPVHYSVAQHSALVCQQFLATNPHSRIDRMTEDRKRLLAKVALLHDAAEAYLGDVTSPLKAELPGFKQMEQQHLAAIFTAFGLDEDLAFDLPREVKQADHLLLQWEQRDLMPDCAWWQKEELAGLPLIRPMANYQAKRWFLEHFAAVFG